MKQKLIVIFVEIILLFSIYGLIIKDYSTAEPKLKDLNVLLTARGPRGIIIVDCNGNGDYTKIQDAIDNASINDSIQVWDGVYFENIIINKSLSIMGNNTITTIIDNQNNIGNAIDIRVDWVNISNFKIKNIWNRSSIWILNTSNIIIRNINCSDNGISISNSKNITIKDNKFSNNSDGISLINSSFSKIFNNICNHNGNGIEIISSNNNSIHNNSLAQNNCGIYLHHSNFNKIEDNNMINCGLSINIGDSEKYWTNIVKNNYVNNNPLIYLENKNYCKIEINAGQIILLNCTNISIKNQNIDNTSIGIYLIHSNNNMIKNITCEFNKGNGISLVFSNQNLIENVTCIRNKYHGISMYKSHLNFIYNCTISNHIFDFDDCGIHSTSSYENKIHNNIISLNSRGIYFDDGSYKNSIKNNSFYSCGEGIYFAWDESMRSHYITSSLNNRFSSYPDYGFKYNIIENNHISNSWGSGISFWDGNYNIIKNNLLENNEYGLNCDSGFSFNLIKNNSFLKNGYGIYFYYGDDRYKCENNTIFHNNFIFNNIQAYDGGINDWNNTSLQEGNYWTDYQGLDNGANGHIAGDCIGDTNLPHHLDYYPLMKPKTWILPPFNPNLIDPGTLSSNGTYNINWSTSIGANYFILEESDNENFLLPNELYKGPKLFFKNKYRENGTYFYRVKAYNDYGVSDWSNIVNITVDWYPDIPKKLLISASPSGNILNISWKPNIIDTTQYLLEYKNETMTNWQKLNPILHPGFTFNHTGLINGERYNYRIQAQDSRDQLSNFSEITSGIPRDSAPPTQPTGLKVISSTYNSITLSWNFSNDSDLEGYLIFRSKIANPDKWGEPIKTIKKGNENYIDIGLNEKTTYYYTISAFDEVPNNSTYSDIVFGTTLLGPHRPEINNSLEDLSIREDIIDYSSINLYYWFKDINNDILKFNCTFNEHLSVIIDQQTGNVTLIPEKNWNGKETLTFYANDSFFEISDEVIITVTPINDPPGPIKIKTPNDGLKVLNGTPINFSAICNDPDLIYGDELFFNWSSNISGLIGSKKNLTNIILVAGHHQIKLEVNDKVGEKVISLINITITENQSIITNQSEPLNPPSKEEKNVHINTYYTYFGVLIIIIIITSIFVFGTEIGKYGFLSAITPLYTKQRRKKNQNYGYHKGLIQGYIDGNPGESYNSIKRSLKLKNGTLAYYLKLLQKENIIKSENDGIYKRFYPTKGNIIKKVLELSSIQQKIYQFIKENPGSSQMDISKKLKIIHSKVNYNVNLLVNARLIKLERDGNKSKCFIVEEV